MTVVLAAHGSPDPRHSDVVTQLRDATAARLGDVRIGWLGHHQPALAEAVAAATAGSAGADREVVVVPLLLAPAFHARVDVRAAAGTARVAPVLAPDDRLLDVLDARVGEALVDNDRLVAPDALVLAAAGSSDPAGDALVRSVAAAWSRRNRLPVAVAYSSAAPGLADALRLLRANGAHAVAVGSLFLAPGRLHDAVLDEADRLDIPCAAAPLGAHPGLVSLVVERAEVALALVPG